VFNTTFNNISVISWRSVSLVEKTGENHWPAASHWQSFITSSEWDSNKLVVIGTDCIGSCKSNYHTIKTMTAPYMDVILHLTNDLAKCQWAIKFYPYLCVCLSVCLSVCPSVHPAFVYHLSKSFEIYTQGQKP
jgi:hypothetical protein